MALATLAQKIRVKLAILRALRFDRYCLALYREIFGREPTPEELAGQTLRLEISRLGESAASVLRDLLRSPESAMALGVRLLGCAVPNSSDADEPVSFFISLGTHCYTSALLARMGMKRFSTPFDWLFSSVEMVAHCLEDDFRIFLDKQYYRPIPADQRPAGPAYGLSEHAYYQQHFGVRFVFNHVDPNTDEGYAYLCRCVERLRAVLASPERKVFVCVTRRHDYSEQSLLRLVNALEASAAHYEMLYMLVDFPDPSRLVPTVEHVSDSRGVRLFVQRPLSHLGGTHFEDPIDELPLARLLHSYAVRLKAPERSTDGGRSDQN